MKSPSNRKKNCMGDVTYAYRWFWHVAYGHKTIVSSPGRGQYAGRRGARAYSVWRASRYRSPYRLAALFCHIFQLPTVSTGRTKHAI